MAARLSKFLVALFILVVASPLLAGNLAYAQTAPEPAPPDVGAHEAIVVEYPTGRILYAKDEHERMSPASLTKVLTAILALEYGNLNDVVTATPDDLVGESTMGLVSGEQQTLHDLLYGMMLPSGNDAAMAIARHLGSTIGASIKSDSNDPIVRFAAMMNARVQQLGLQDTHFVTPHGLDSEAHFSTAYDLASLSWYALHIPQFNEIVSQPYYEAPGHALQNTNEMLTRYPGADGVKTGWTDGCGLCLITSATRDGHRLIAVVLNAPNWWVDSASILDYGFARLAAKPADPTAEVLSVSKSGVVSSILANPVSVMPVAPPMAQGGGVSSVQTEASKPGVAQNTGPSAPVVAELSNASTTTRAQTTLGSSGGAGLLWLAVLVAVGLVGLVVAARVLGWRVRFRRNVTAFPPGADQLAAYADSQLYKPVPRATVRTLGGPQVPLTRRREPNLLMKPEDTYFLHIDRAVGLAADGRQGSSMSEFLTALRTGGPIDVAVLAEDYQLSAVAFLALARAQYAVNQLSDARQTLLHGMIVLPHERTLRQAMHSLPPD
jgi:D-alanyl-D-alanine carboxypeptidase (penicillin-binding protein 5/6)